jgi:glutathione peroxidase
MSRIYDFTAQSLAGEEVPLKRFEGQVLLIVNTASACGFTPQYKGLEALHRELSGRGFAVLGFPCNQFGAQEPGDASAIEAFCETKYHVTFPMFAKIDVNGSRAHPLYEYLRGEKSGLLPLTSTNPSSPYYNEELLSRDVGIRFKGAEKTNVEEYCISEGWIRVTAGNAKDRYGNPLTIKVHGPVEPYFRDKASS